MSNLASYKRAVRAAHRYNRPSEDLMLTEKQAAKHEERWEELSSVAADMEAKLTSDERVAAIEWLAENRLYGYMDEVC